MRTCKIPVIATLLLFAFTQKLGILVLMHNKFHAAAQINKKENSASYYQVKCECLDEALAPISKPDSFELPLPDKNHIERLVTTNISFPSALKIYRSLRAPPIFI